MALGASPADSELLEILGFARTRKNPRNWWRIYDPNDAGSRAHARKSVLALKNLGIKAVWKQVDPSPPHAIQRTKPSKPRFSTRRLHAPHGVGAVPSSIEITPIADRSGGRPNYGSVYLSAGRLFPEPYSEGPNNQP